MVDSVHPMKPYYEHGGVTIFHGDCREWLAQQADMVDVVITDPPYSPHTHTKQWIGAALTASGAARVGTKFSELGFEPLSDELRLFVAMHAARLCRRWFLTFADLKSISAWAHEIQAAGLEYVRTAIWDKIDSAPQFTGDRPASAAEAIVIGHPCGAKRWNGGGRRNVFRHAVNGERGNKPHPTTKPLALMKELVSLFSDEGETVVDLFAGSGRTLRAAKDLNRKAIGIEIEERYCEIAANQLSQEVLF